MSSRRRPMTSPPGGGTTARPQRASSGPARRTDARIRWQSSSSSSCRGVSAAWIRTSPAPSRSTSTPEVLDELEHRLDVKDRRDVRQGDRLFRQEARGDDRERGVLVAGRAHPAREGLPAVDDERLHEALRDEGSGHGGWKRGGGAPRNPAILANPMEVTRDRAWQTLTAYTKSESLLRHALAVEASVRAYARRFGEDEELWGCDGAPARLRLRDPSHARRAPAGRSADPP